jgi:hypothetical protein
MYQRASATGRIAGPLIPGPSGVNCEPWHGQSASAGADDDQVTPRVGFERRPLFEP